MALHSGAEHNTAHMPWHGIVFLGGLVDRLREVWASLESRLHVQLPGLPEKLPAMRG